jgi:hypothetical protein
MVKPAAASRKAYRPLGGAIQAPCEGATMSDKSPRQAMAKKSGKSLKEKRADKKSKSSAQSNSEIVAAPKKR